jgi:CheY-like chemotaxis protein
VGFQVRTAENGEAAVLSWIEWKPQLILMDIHMPVMDGLEATRHIRSIPEGEKTVIVVLTADVMEEQRAAALTDGADAFLSKPVDEGVLLESIGKHLGLTYIYAGKSDGELASPATAGPGRGGPGAQPAVPADLVPQMRDAILRGDKALLDSLILTIDDRGDTLSAGVLREMANKYQYDRLIEFLEKI